MRPLHALHGSRKGVVSLVVCANHQHAWNNAINSCFCKRNIAQKMVNRSVAAEIPARCPLVVLYKFNISLRGERNVPSRETLCMYVEVTNSWRNASSLFDF